MIILKEDIPLIRKAFNLVLRIRDDETTLELDQDDRDLIVATMRSDHKKERSVRRYTGDWVSSHLKHDSKFQTFASMLRANDEVLFYIEQNGCDLTRQAGIEVYEIHAIVKRKTKRYTFVLGNQYQATDSPYKQIKKA